MEVLIRIENRVQNPCTFTRGWQRIFYSPVIKLQVNRSTGLLYAAYIEWCCSTFFRLCNFRLCPNITQNPSQPTADTTVIE